MVMFRDQKSFKLFEELDNIFEFNETKEVGEYELENCDIEERTLDFIQTVMHIYNSIDLL